jgi:hypothetical protein
MVHSAMRRMDQPLPTNNPASLGKLAPWEKLTVPSHVERVPQPRLVSGSSAEFAQMYAEGQ